MGDQKRMSRTITMGPMVKLIIACITLCIQNQQTSAFTPITQVISSPKIHRDAKLSSIPIRIKPSSSTVFEPRLNMSVDNEAAKSSLPMLLDPGTKGGALFLSFLLFLVPIVGYEIVTIGFGIDPLEAGKWIGVVFTLVICFAWVGSYVFRVATKDMTYAKQLKDYENAVIAKRLEELDEDEVQALIEDIERDDF